MIIKQQVNYAKSDYDKKKLNERLGNLNNGIAAIKVGGTTDDTELKEKKLRIEDALNATKAAISEGIVMGGGATLVNAYVALKSKLKSDSADVQKGIQIVLDSLLKPMYQIVENACYNSDEIIENQMKVEEGIGFDAKSGKWVSMFEKGIMDPTKVTRSALLNAASISAIFITTETGVAFSKDEKYVTQQMSEII